MTSVGTYKVIIVLWQNIVTYAHSKDILHLKSSFILGPIYLKLLLYIKLLTKAPHYIYINTQSLRLFQEAPTVCNNSAKEQNCLCRFSGRYLMGSYHPHRELKVISQMLHHCFLWARVNVKAIKPSDRQTRFGT